MSERNRRKRAQGNWGESSLQAFNHCSVQSVRSPGWSHAAQAHADEVAAALPATPRKQDEDVTAWGLQRPMN